MKTRMEAICNTHKNVVSTVNGEAFDKDRNPVEIDEDLVTTEIVRFQVEYDALEYQRERAESFPSIGDQLDMQYWDSVNGTTTWIDAIAKVKADNPKP